jgi:hypothetical protein
VTPAEPAWDTEVHPSHYAGHPGLLYRCSPATFADLVAGTVCWTPRSRPSAVLDKDLGIWLNG